MERFYQEVLKDAGAGYWEWNIPENTGYFSPEYKALLGYEPNDFNNSYDIWQTLIVPEDIHIIQKGYKQHVFSKGKIPYRNEVRYIHKNGKIVWMISTGRVVKWDEAGNPILLAGAFIDITQKKENEIALNKAKTFLSNATHTAKVGGWELDLISGKLQWDEVTRQIHEVAPDYNPSLERAVLFYKEGKSRDAISYAVAQAITEGKMFDLELEIVTQKERTIEIRAIGHAEFKGGKCIRLHGIMQDIDEKNKIKKQLNISEDQFQGTFDYSVNGMSIANTEGYFLKVNDTFCNMVGYSEDELKTMNFGEITHPDDLKEDLHHLKEMLAGKIHSFSMEKRYFHKTGYTIWVLLNVTLVRDSNGTPLHFIAQTTNISNSKKNEAELLKVNQELSAILNAGTEVAIISTDLQGTIQHFSKGAENLLGYTAEEVEHIHQPSLFHVVEEMRARRKELEILYNKKIDGFDVFITIAKEGKYEEREWSYVKKDGTIFPVQLTVTAIKNIQGEITGFLGVAIDISEIKKAEKALLESQQQLQFALEGSGEGIWDWDVKKNSIFFSAQGKQILGYEDHEIENHISEWFRKVHPEDILKLYRDYKKHLQDDSSLFLNEHRILCKDNTYKWILIRGKIIEYNLNKEPIRIMGTFADTSWQKGKEKELQDAIDIVSEQNKRLLNFTYIVSHNLRTHSANFELGFNLLNDKDTSIEEKLDIIHQLQSVSSKLSDTINNLNEVISIQSNINKQRKKIKLNEYISKTLSILSGEIETHQIIIENKIYDNLEVLYNPAYLESILLNFLSNAIKYRSIDRIPRIILNCSWNKDHNSFILQIKDNGRGIDLEKHGKDLFGMYKTFHRNTDAKGIGLFITKNQVEAMGGKIEVESEVGIGTTFNIYLSQSRGSNKI